MGNVQNITGGTFPTQGPWLGVRTKVCFHYDTSRTVMGTIVRDDNEEPWQTIIQLDDGRYVLGSECQHAPQIGAGPCCFSTHSRNTPQ